MHRARTALGPAGAAWLRRRVEGEFPILTGLNLRSARPNPAGIELSLSGPGGDHELAADHVIAATGYRADVRRLAFLADGLRDSIRTVAGTPVLDRDYQSSVPSLYFACRLWPRRWGRSCDSFSARTTRRERSRRS